MSNRNDATNWRSQLASFVDHTDSNLKSMRKDAAPAPISAPALPLGGRIPVRHPEAVANARAELSTLLAAVQGSLADLRVEVAAAKRLSTNASAVAAGDISPVSKGPSNRSASVQPRAREQRAPTDLTPPLQVRMPATTPAYPANQPFGLLFTTTPGSDAIAVSPAAMAVTTPASVASSAAPQNEELVKAIDQRLLELGHKIERSLERSMEEQSLRAQLQQAVQAATALQQQQQMMLRSSAPSQVFAGFNPLGAAGGAASDAPRATANSVVSATGDGSSGPTAVAPTAAPAGGAAAGSPSPLVLLAMNKADAAEKLVLDVRGELQVLQKQAAKDLEDSEKRMVSLQDAQRQHWEKMCQVSSQVDTLLAQRAGSAELQGEMARVVARLVQLEANQDRALNSVDEHQRLMRQLTTALQKLTQEAESERAISSSRNGELAAKLEASGARMSELEARVARASEMEARMGRLADVEVKLARLGDIESRVSRVADVEARLSRLPDLEVKVARLGDVEAKMNRLGDVEAKLARLGDLEARVARLSDVEARLGRLSDMEVKLARLGEAEGRLARLGDVEVKMMRLADLEAKLARVGDVEGRLARINEMEEARLARMGEMEAKLSRLGDLELRMARLGDAEARMARVPELEARMARLGDAEARLVHLGDLEARVAALQASVSAASAVAANAATSRSSPPAAATPSAGPDPTIQEALQRMAALEQQVARLAAAEEASQVHDRRRVTTGQPTTAYPSSDGVRSTDGIPAALVGLFNEALHSPQPTTPANGGASGLGRRSVPDRPASKDVEARIKALEEAVLQSGSFGGPGASRSMQTLMARMERLEQIVRAENSIEAMAQEARLAVAEDFVLELRRDFHDVVGPTLERLAMHVSELRRGQGSQASPDSGRVTSELRALNNRLENLDAQVAQITAHEHSSSATAAAIAAASRGLDELPQPGVPSAVQERLDTLELQVQELNRAVEDNGSIFSRLQRHQASLDRLQMNIEEVRNHIAAEVDGLNARVSSTAGDVSQLQVNLDDTRDQLAALARLDDQLDGVSVAVQDLAHRLAEQGDKVAEMERRQRQHQEAGAVSLRQLSDRLEEQEGRIAGLQLEKGADTEAVVQDLAERVEGQESKVAELEEQQKAGEMSLLKLSESVDSKVSGIEEQQKAATAAVHNLAGRLDVQQDTLAQLAEQQREQQRATEAATASVQNLTERVAGQEGKIADLTKQQRDQQKAAEAAVTSLTKRLGGQDGKMSDLEEQQRVAKAAVQGLTERLDQQEAKVSELREQQRAAEAAAADGAAAAAAGAGVLSRSLGSNAAELAAVEETVGKAPLEELGTELRSKLADVRTSINDMRKELGSKVQVLDAQTQELLAFREEMLSSYVELQDGVERASGVADDALRKVEAHEPKLQVLSEQVDLQAQAIERAAAQPVIDEMQSKLQDLQKRVSASALEQQEKLVALDAKVHALSELLTAASQDSKAAIEARNRADELAYELSQAQESLETLALDSGRLAEQLAAVASVSDKTAEQLGRIQDDFKAYDAAMEQLQGGLHRLEGRVAAIPASAAAAGLAATSSGSVLRLRSPLPPRVSEAAEGGEEEEEQDDLHSEATPGNTVTPPRLGVTLPATRAGVPASQAILNPLYSASSEDMVFAGVAPSSTSSPPNAAAMHPALSPALPGAGRGRAVDAPLPPLPPPPPLLSQESSSSVRDKAMFYEQLASKNVGEGVFRRSPAASTAASEAGLSRESSAGAVHPHAPQPVELAAEPSDGSVTDLISPGAAAAAASGAVGLAGVRQAAQAAGSSRSLPPTAKDCGSPAVPASEPVPAAGALAAVRAVRSGLGLSGDLSSPKMGLPALNVAYGDVDARGSSAGGLASPSVFGREQTFRRGAADEEVSISSGEEEEDSKKVAEGTEAVRRLGREQTFRKGEADEEVSISSSSSSSEDGGDDKEGEASHAGDAGLLASAPLKHDSFGADDDDDLGLAGLAPPKPEVTAPSDRTAAESAPDAQSRGAKATTPVSLGRDSEQSDSGDIDEDIELEPGVNPSCFDYDDDEDLVWPGTSGASQQGSGSMLTGRAVPAPPAAADVAAAKEAGAAAAAAAASSQADTSPIKSPSPPAPTGQQAVDVSNSLLSNSGTIGGPQLAPLQLSSNAAAVFTASGELGRRKLPPLSPLAGGASAGGPLGASNLSTSRGLDLTPPLLRPALGSLQNSGNLSGNLSGDLQALFGDAPSSRSLAVLPPLRTGPLPPIGSGMGTSPLAGAGGASSAKDSPPAPDAAKPMASPGEGAGAKTPAAGVAAKTPEAVTGAEPVSPLRCLLLSQPTPHEPHPSVNLDNEIPMPAVPGANTDTSGSAPVSDAIEVSGLSREASMSGQQASESPPMAPLELASAPRPPPVVALSNRGLAALLDSDSDSFHGDHFGHGLSKQTFSGSFSGNLTLGLAGSIPASAVAVAPGGFGQQHSEGTDGPAGSPSHPTPGPLSSQASRSMGLAELLRPADAAGADTTFFASPSSSRKGSMEGGQDAGGTLGENQGRDDEQESGEAQQPESHVQDEDVEADTVAEEVDEQYDDDFDDGGASSVPRGTSPVVTGAPSAASMKVPKLDDESLIEDDSVCDEGDDKDEGDDGGLGLPNTSPGAGPAHGSLSATDSTASLDALAPPPKATERSSSSGGGAGATGAGRPLALPPLPPGTRPGGLPPLANPPAPAGAASRGSILTSEDSLALIAPPEGAALLGDGSDDEDIFAASDELDAAAAAVSGLSQSFSRASDLGAPEPAAVATATAAEQQRRRESAGGIHAESSRLRQLLEQGGLSVEQSAASLDFNGELSVEAERIAAMLANEPPVGTHKAGISTDDDIPMPNVRSSGGGLMSIYGPPPPGSAGRDGAAVQRSLDVATTPTSSASRGAPAAPGAATPTPPPPSATAATALRAADEQLVQGSLDFNDEEEESSSSSSSSDDRHGAEDASPGAGGSGQAVAGVSGQSGLSGLAYSDDSMELEVFRPPPPPQQQAQSAPSDKDRQRTSLSGDSSSAALQRQLEKMQKQAVPASSFANSLGDMSTSSGAYRMQVLTGKRTGASCGQGVVQVTMYGSEGTHVAQLRPLAQSGRYSSSNDRDVDDYFAPGSCEEFMVDSTCGDLGDLSALHIWHEGEGYGASWYVESITVEQLMTGLEWTFEVNDWVKGGQRGGKVVRQPGAQLSISRENSLTRLAAAVGGGSLPGSQPGTPKRVAPATAAAAVTPKSGAAAGVSGASGTVPQRRGMAAMGDESLDVSSEMPSPVSGGHDMTASLGGRSGLSSDGLPPLPGARQQSALEAVYASGANRSGLGAERSGGTGLRSGSSVHFSDADEDEALVPGMGGGAGTGGAGTPSSSAFAGATAAAAAASGRPRVASNVPAGIGLVLEEDIEEVDGMMSNSTAFSLGPVTTRSGATLVSPALVSPRPPLPPGAPRRRDFTDDLDDAAAEFSGIRRPALPPTPPNRRNSGSASFSGRRLSSSALEAESSLESLGGGTGGLGSRRRVRISGGGEDDLTSELSVEGSELSIASAASLSLYCPGGVRPPPLAGAVNVDYLGTSRKRVSWAEYAEEFEFLRDDANSTGSVASMTEEDLLAAQGETVRPDSSSVGYDDLIRGSGRSGSITGLGPVSPSTAAGVGAGGAAAEGGGDGAGFTEVPLKQRRGQHANSYGYKIKVFTADKLNAGLGNTTVHLELLGRDATVCQALPKEKSTFQRGCVDRFTLYSNSGDMGQLLALKVWHEGKTIGPGNWGFEQVVIDDRLKGTRYVFRNPDAEGVLRKGRRHCLVLKPAVSRIDESEDLAEVAREYETQLSANRDLSESERAGLRGKLEKINQRLTKLGTKLARSMSGGLSFK